MTISNSFDISVIKPLRYTTKIGQIEVSSPALFPVFGNRNSNYILGEQAIDLKVTGLKPNTFHKAFLNGVDVTSYCKQVGRLLGTGLISTNHNPFTTSASNFGGDIFFTFYFRPEIFANTPAEQSAAEANLLGGQRVLTLRSNDGLSIASIGFNLPAFAKNEPTISIKKTPDDASGIARVQILANDPPVSTQQYIQPVQYSLVQTFFADKEIVQNSGEVFLTSVDLFFKNKPNINTSVSGNPQPGVSVAICEVENNAPVVEKTVANSLTRKQYSEIFSYSDASTPTTFSFTQPIRLSTDRFYGIVVIFEDPSYELWKNVVGDKLVGTNIASSGGNSNKDGKLFSRNNSGVYNPVSDADLKFDLKCARFTETNEIKKFVPFDYEFFTISNRSGNFIGGESIFQVANAATGTISVQQGSTEVVGTGTQFTQLSDDEVFVISTGAGAGDNHIALVETVANNTYMTLSSPVPFTNASATYIRTVVGKLYYQDVVNSRMILTNSTANTAVFVQGRRLKGTLSGATANIASIDNLSIDRVRIQGDVSTPSLGNLKIEASGTNFNGSTFTYSPANKINLTPNSLTTTNVTNFNQFILSRSNEIVNNGLLIDEDNLINRKSLLVNVTLESDGNPYNSPSVLNSELNLIVGENLVSQTVDSSANGVTLDTEVSNFGTAKSRHISNKVTFDVGRFAEDLKVFMTAYRPLGTELRVYAKLYNSNDSEPFDDKAWTPLQYVGSNVNKYSSSQDLTDFVEYELAIPKFSEAIATSNVSFTSTGTVLTSSDPARLNPSNFVSNNEIIRVYDPIFGSDSYSVVPVLSANSSAIVLASPAVTGNVLVDKLKYPNINFANADNDGETRYYNTQAAAFDGFDTMQIKVVFTSQTSYLVPRIDQMQVIGVSV